MDGLVVQLPLVFNYASAVVVDAGLVHVVVPQLSGHVFLPLLVGACRPRTEGQPTLVAAVALVVRKDAILRLE